MSQTKIPPPPRKPRESPPTRDQVLNNLEKPAPDETETLNFRVKPAFKREFKAFAASHGMDMKELLEWMYERAKREPPA